MSLGKQNAGLNINTPTLGSKGAQTKAAWQAAGATALNALGTVNTGDRNGLFDTLDPVYHLAGGRESTVGNALSDAGVTLTKSGNPWMMLAGAGLKIVGGLTNAAFGVKENKENVQFIKNNTDLARTVGKGFGKVSTSDELLSAAGRMTGGSGFKWSDLYENGWFTSAGTEKGNKLIG